MKYIIAFYLAALPLVALPQVFLKKIEIGFNRDIVRSESEDLSVLAKKVSSAYEKALKSLSNKFAFNFIVLSKGTLKDADLVATVKIGYGEGNSYEGLFEYQTETIFTAAKTDSVVAKIQKIYKDLSGISEELLTDDSYEMFQMMMLKLAIPIDSILNPLSSKKESQGICVVIDKVIRSNSRNNNTAKAFTNILNNAIVFQQSQNPILYYDQYKGGIKSKISSSCRQIRGVLTDTNDKYVLLLEYDPLLNIQSPKKVKTKFTFTKKLIDDGDYYEAVWQLNKSIYDLIADNAR